MKQEEKECCSQREERKESCCSDNKPCCEQEQKEEKAAFPEAATYMQEVQEWKDKYFRALAEIENSRKRLMREKAEAQGIAIQNMMTDLLQPFDQLELALMHANKASQEVSSWALGFQMILDHFRQIFSSYDVYAFSAMGAIFDPHLHEAIETEERDDVREGQIIQEFQKGYKMGTKTIRPAKVKVAMSRKKENSST